MTEPRKLLAPLAGLVRRRPDGTTVQKFSAVVPVTRDFAIDHGLLHPTEAERRDRERQHAKYAAQKAAATEAWPVFVAALAVVTDPVARVVLNIHGNRDGYCQGCEFNGYEAEPPAWPCATTTSVAAAVGIRVPEDLWMAEQAKL